MKHLPDSDIATAYLGGKSSYQLAEEFGVSPGVIMRRLRTLGIPLRSPKERCVNRELQGRSKYVAPWQGKHLSAETKAKMSAKLSGPGNGRWKDGSHSCLYRNVVKKEQCFRCPSRANLGIHHVDFDHYNDAPENLQVLCVSCHMSLHAVERETAKREGREPKRSNGPIGWGSKQGRPVDV